MAELVYANDSKSFSVRIVSSSLTSGTKLVKRNFSNKNEAEMNSDLDFCFLERIFNVRKSEKTRGGLCARFDGT